MRYSFDDDDLFERRKYADFLVRLIDGADRYRRNDESRSYSIAVDAGYGSGKTVFMRKLAALLEERPDTYGVVYYNAWKHDLSEDALSPLVFDLVGSEFFEQVKKDDKLDGVLKTVKKAIVPVLKTTGKIGAHILLGEKTAEYAAEYVDALKAKDGDFEEMYKSYRQTRENVDRFAEAMGDAIEAAGVKRLVVIIDELDRCKPLFAIQTLEVVKHIMNVRDAVFLFAVDMGQMCHSVKAVYGAGCDAEGYLLRFFDYVSRMPGVKSEFQARWLYRYAPEKVEDGTKTRVMMKAQMMQLVEVFGLTLRETEKIFASFFMLMDYLLNRYDQIDAKRLYLICLVLKYKEPEFFMWMSKSKDINKRPGHVQVPGLLFNAICKYATQKIELSALPILSLKDGMMTSNEHRLIAYEGLSDKTIYFKDNINSNISTGWPIKQVYQHSIAGILYGPDWEILSSLEGFTYGEFIHRQLEMFNFAPEQPIDTP